MSSDEVENIALGGLLGLLNGVGLASTQPCRHAVISLCEFSMRVT